MQDIAGNRAVGYRNIEECRATVGEVTILLPKISVLGRLQTVTKHPLRFFWRSIAGT